MSSLQFSGINPITITAAHKTSAASYEVSFLLPKRSWQQLVEVDRGYAVEADRRRAIHAAIRIGRPGDIVLIAGKGHEDYQVVGTTRRHFDDREEALKALAKLGEKSHA